MEVGGKGCRTEPLWVHPMSSWDDVATPMGLESRALSQRGLILSLNVICPIRFWSYLGPIDLFLCWNRNVCPMPVPLLYFGSTEHVWFHSLQLEENLPQDESYLDSSHESDLGDI